MLDQVYAGRRRGLCLAAVIAAVGILFCGWVATSGAADANGNRAAARAEASRLLSLIKLPAGTTSAPSEPAGDQGELAQPGWDSATPNLVDAWGWWTTALKPRDVLTYVETHLPPGARLEASANGSTGMAGETFSFGPIPGVLSDRVISITVVPLGGKGKGTGVRTDGEAIWLTPRPAWEQIPGAVRSITFTAQGSTPTGRAGRVSAPRTLTGSPVRRLVAFINGLGVVQPGVHPCPAGHYRLVRLTFRAADGRVLAGAVEHPTGCASVALSIGGRAGPALTDYPTVTGELERLGAIPRCTGRELRAAANPLARDVGGDVLTLTFTNRSAVVCRVSGFPRLRLVDGRGQRLRVSLHHVGTAASVVLAPGEAVWASTVSTRCNAHRARRVRVALPGTSATFTLRVRSRRRPYAPCHGRINVSSLTPAF